MTKSICVIFARYTGWIPYECNCTNVDADSSEVRTDLGYDPARDSHAVVHHGSTFNTTKLVDDAIAKLRAVDMVLYELAKEIFHEQVQEVQDEFQVQLCDNFRARPNFTYYKVPTKKAQAQKLE